MGTLGCINDMLRRDKENRELRKLNKERIKEHYKYIVKKGNNFDTSNVTIEKLEEVIKFTQEKKHTDNLLTIKVYAIISVIALLVLSAIWLLMNFI